MATAKIDGFSETVDVERGAYNAATGLYPYEVPQFSQEGVPSGTFHAIVTLELVGAAGENGSPEVVLGHCTLVVDVETQTATPTWFNGEVPNGPPL